MPWVGGTFSRVRNWQADATNGIPIRADYHDNEDDNLATGINQTLNLAGQNSPTANISMATFRFTNCGAGVAGSDFSTLYQSQTNVAGYGVDSAGTNSYAITLTPAVGALVAGQSFKFKAGFTNTGAATLNVNGLGATSIVKNYNVPLAAGDITLNQIYTVVYDGTNFQMVGFAPQPALKADMITATDAAKYVTPAVVQNHPGVAKAYGRFSSIGGTITINNSYNVSSITYNAQGNFYINYTTAFTNGNYVFLGSQCYTNLTNFYNLAIVAGDPPQASLTHVIGFYLTYGGGSNISNNQSDMAYWGFTCYGTQ